jgi:hypothetical protein
MGASSKHAAELGSADWAAFGASVDTQQNMGNAHLQSSLDTTMLTCTSSDPVACSCTCGPGPAG